MCRPPKLFRFFSLVREGMIATLAVGLIALDWHRGGAQLPRIADERARLNTRRACWRSLPCSSAADLAASILLEDVEGVAAYLHAVRTPARDPPTEPGADEQDPRRVISMNFTSGA